MYDASLKNATEPTEPAGAAGGPSSVLRLVPDTSRSPKVTSARTADGLAMVCLLLDDDGAVSWANDAALGLFGRVSADHVAGPSMTDLVHEVDRSMLTAAIGVARRGDRNVEVLVHLKHDEERYLHLILALNEDPDAGFRPGKEFHRPLVVQGWDVSTLVLRMHEMEIRARRDPLTGLANRTTFSERLCHEVARSARTGLDVAVLFADIDGFKAVNDTHGQDAGDGVLLHVSRRMTQSLRPADTLARMGGDEFAVICPDIAGAQQVMTVADRLRVAAAEPLNFRDQQLSVTMSIGVALVMDNDQVDPAGLLRRADTAMYKAKRHRAYGFRCRSRCLMCAATPGAPCTNKESGTVYRT